MRSYYVVKSVTILLALTALVIAPSSIAMRGGISGFDWEKFDANMKLLFVLAHLKAYRLGYDEACRIVAVHERSPKIQYYCHDNMPMHGKSSNTYVDLISEFYERYPSHKKTPIDLLLEQMTDQKDMSLEEIYEYFEKNWD